MMDVDTEIEEQEEVVDKPTSSVLRNIRNKIIPIRRTGYIHNGKVLLDLGYGAEEEYLKSVVKQVIVGNSEGVKVSSSIMVYGPPGCGKSQLMDKVIACSEKEFGDDSFDVVRLEGAYCFSLQDSVKEICNQVMYKKEGEGEDQDVSNELDLNDGTPFDERLEKILSYLKTKLIETKRSLIVIIDGMERFVDDSSQRLLYNLFDISANSVFSVPICIVGITPCVDILDSFEKRVRSRFSHRQVNLVPKVEFAEYEKWAKKLLSHSKSSEWNEQIEKVMSDKEMIKVLRMVYEADKSIGQLKRFLYTAVLHCDETFSQSNIQDAYSQLYGGHSLVHMALDLPLSDVVVLLGIYKKTQRSQQAWLPMEIFEIIRRPYSLYQLRKEDFVKTVLKLQDFELIIPVGGSRQSGNNVFESYFKCEISYVEFQDIWTKYPNLPSFYKEFL